MPLPSIGTAVAVEYAESTLPMAIKGQLQWVKRPLSSLSTLDSSQTHYLWWPSLLFNDYGEFQDFFPVEFDTTNNEATETKSIILARIFQNMRLQRSIMVARLLGRSIKEYVEIVEEPVREYSKSDEFAVHEATEFISFARMPQEVLLPQMDPATWIVESSAGAAGNSQTSKIDDDLYTSYMLALDLAETKRIGGPSAPRDTLGSHFRDLGREKLAKIPANVKRLSETSSVALPDEEAVNGQEPTVDSPTMEPVTFAENLPDLISPETEPTVDSPTMEPVTFAENLPDLISPETEIYPETSSKRRLPKDTSLDLYMERLAMRETAPSKDASIVTDDSICKEGNLGIRRLDRTLDHLPVESRGAKKRCAMHRWQSHRKEGKLMYCRSCNVNLCADCYDLFHKVEKIEDLSELFCFRLKSSRTPDKGQPSAKCTQCTDAELAYGSSLSSRRLDKSIDHTPVRARKKKKCSMHRWLGFRKEGNLLHCGACNVTLCTLCYDEFHKVRDIVAIKYWLKQEYLERGERTCRHFWETCKPCNEDIFIPKKPLSNIKPVSDVAKGSWTVSSKSRTAFSI